jgi:hypothetical protein
MVCVTVSKGPEANRPVHKLLEKRPRSGQAWLGDESDGVDQRRGTGHLDLLDHAG